MNLNGFDRWFEEKKGDSTFIAAFKGYLKDARDRKAVPEHTSLKGWAYGQYEALPRQPNTVADHFRRAYG